MIQKERKQEKATSLNNVLKQQFSNQIRIKSSFKLQLIPQLAKTKAKSLITWSLQKQTSSPK